MLDTLRRIAFFSALAFLATVALSASPARAQDSGDYGGGDEADVTAPDAPPRDTSLPTAEDAEDREAGKLTYDPEGRRDPFRPLTGEAPAEEERSQFAGTLRGLLWDQAKLTAILRTPSGPVAMFEGGADKRGYTAREGDRFWNGIVYRIDFETGTVTVREELSDPRLLKPYRDHPIPLHPNEVPGGSPSSAARAARGARSR